MNKDRIFFFFQAIRLNQWIKNLIVFTAIIFSGQLLNIELFLRSLFVFFIFCLLSSTSYVLNDIIDYPHDRKHPFKKYRPIASGKITIAEATFIVFTFSLFSLLIALFFSLPFFFISFIFILLHFFYSLYLKRQPVLDIFSISFSFMLRAFAGEVATSYHIPIWLLLTIFFLSLFMASVKRHAELAVQGERARISLYRYNEHFLNFLTYISATSAIITYAFYTYFEKLPTVDTVFTQFFSGYFPSFEARKWLMTTIPLVVYGVARYAQLLYERYEGERPEKIITTDKPLIATIFIWGFIVILLIYII